MIWNLQLWQTCTFHTTVLKKADQTDRGGSVYFSYSNYILFWMDSENVFSSLQSGCNQGSMAEKREDSQADARAPTIQSPPTQTHTLKHTRTHARTVTDGQR